MSREPPIIQRLAMDLQSIEANVPHGFLDLVDVRSSAVNSVVNFIGVIVDIMAPRMTSRGQEMLTIQVVDTRLRDIVDVNQGLKVRFFRKPNGPPFPEIQTRGDVASFRNMRINIVSGETVVIDTNFSDVLVFPAKSMPELSFSLAYISNANQKLSALGNPRSIERLTGEEQAYIIALNHKLHNTITGLNAHSAHDVNLTKRAAITDLASKDSKKIKVSSFGTKFSLIQDVQHYDFKDLVVEVVKKFPDQWGGCELYVTDYTSNKDLFYYGAPEEDNDVERDGDPHGYSAVSQKPWQGPFGQLVLKVNIKPPHASFTIDSVRVGNIVLLKNVKLKAGQHSANAKLEGDMWRDDKWPEKVNVSVLRNHPAREIEELLRRKDKYYESRHQQTNRNDNQQEASVERSKAARKRDNKKKKIEAARKKNQSSIDGADNQDDTHDKSTTSGAPQAVNNGATVNKHVRANFKDYPIVPLAEILDVNGERHKIRADDDNWVFLPYVNCRIRSKVRVVGFEPADLEDWAVPAESESADDSLRSIDTMDYEASQRWEWNFALHLEDMTAPEALDVHRDRIKVQVHHEHAQFLFGNEMPDPQDLHTHPDILSRLRYKMSILWGDLEESFGNRPPSNVPFECCIQEYGCKIDDDDAEALQEHPYGWMKFYELFGTTILS